MPSKEGLMKILEEQYGITSQKQLAEAILRQPKLDISVFVSKLPERKNMNAQVRREAC